MIANKSGLMLGCTAVFFALQSGYAQESSTTVRINYFSNFQSIQGNLAPSDGFVRKSGATRGNTELLAAYRSGNAFIINVPAGISPETLKTMNAAFVKTAEIRFIENPTTILLFWPPGNDNLTDALFSELSAKPATQQSSRISLKKGYILKARLPDGRYIEAVSDRETIDPGDWFKILLVDSQLNLGANRVTAKSLAKIFGGSGFLSAMATRGRMEEADINIGLTWTGSTFFGLPAKAAVGLWNETKTRIYAATPYDLPTLRHLLETTSQEPVNIPELVSSNISLSSSTLGGRIKKYAVKEVKGVKIGFFFVMDNKTIPALLGPLPAELADPVDAAKEMVKALVDEEKVDIVIMLAMFLENDLQDVLTEIHGVDIVVNTAFKESFTVARTNLVELENWGDERSPPALVAGLTSGRIEKLQLDFLPHDGKKRLASIREESEGLDFAVRSRNEYDAYDDAGFTADLTSGTYLLPDSMELWHKSKHQYTPLEISNLSAVILDEKIKNEIAFLKITPFPISTTGNIPESVIRRWLQHRKIFTAELDGENLRALLKQIDFDRIPVASDFDWAEKYRKGNWLAACGVSQDGRVRGIPINSNETYTVAFTGDLPSAIKDFPALSGIRRKSDTGLYLDDIVVDRLQRMKQDFANTEYHGQLRRLMAAASAPRWRWRLNIKDAGLQFSQTQVSNTQAFSQVPNSKLQASDQLFLQGSVRLALESRRETFWDDTKVSLDYGKIIIKPAGQGKLENETADRMLFENEMRYAAFRWDRFGGAVAGPLISLGYNTEFTHDAGIPRRKIAVGKAGIKVFEGTIIQDLYTAAVLERDFTFPDAYTKLAWETGAHLGGLIRGNGPEYSVDVSYKQFSPSRLRATDLKREFELAAKLRIRVFSDLSLDPFADFYIAKGVSPGKVAHNYIFGISLSYARLFKLRN